MAQTVEIQSSSGNREGIITFHENPANLHAQRTADGFRLNIPIKISFILVPEDAPMPMLSNLRGTIIAGDSPGSRMEIGQIYSDSWYVGGRISQYSPSGITENEGHLTWRGSLTELAMFEKIRDGKTPQFEFSLSGEVCYLFKDVHPHYKLRSEPKEFYSRHGNVRITYPREVWIKMLQGLGVAENVLVEVPLPANPLGAWDPVWRALMDARNYFEQGGETGWKGCVASTRLALEKWRGIEVEDPGPGFV